MLVAFPVGAVSLSESSVPLSPVWVPSSSLEGSSPVVGGTTGLSPVAGSSSPLTVA